MPTVRFWLQQRYAVAPYVRVRVLMQHTQVVRAASYTGRSSPKCVIITYALCTRLIQVFQCYASSDVPSQCNVQAEDYLECLHHTKEVRTCHSRTAPTVSNYNICRPFSHGHLSLDCTRQDRPGRIRQEGYAPCRRGPQGVRHPRRRRCAWCRPYRQRRRQTLAFPSDLKYHLIWSSAPNAACCAHMAMVVQAEI